MPTPEELNRSLIAAGKDPFPWPETPEEQRRFNQRRLARGEPPMDFSPRGSGTPNPVPTVIPRKTSPPLDRDRGNDDFAKTQRLSPFMRGEQEGYRRPIEPPRGGARSPRELAGPVRAAGREFSQGGLPGIVGRAVWPWVDQGSSYVAGEVRQSPIGDIANRRGGFVDQSRMLGGLPGIFAIARALEQTDTGFIPDPEENRFRRMVRQEQEQPLINQLAGGLLDPLNLPLGAAAAPLMRFLTRASNITDVAGAGRAARGISDLERINRTTPAGLGNVPDDAIQPSFQRALNRREAASRPRQALPAAPERPMLESGDPDGSLHLRNLLDNVDPGPRRYRRNPDVDVRSGGPGTSSSSTRFTPPEEEGYWLHLPDQEEFVWVGPGDPTSNAPVVNSMEEALQRLDEAQAHLEGISTRGAPPPAFGTTERAVWEAERRGRPSLDSQRQAARQAFQDAKSEVRDLGATPPAAPPSQAIPDVPVPGSAADPKLPRDLAGARPRYNIARESYMPRFESDVDKALYIVAGNKPSKKDAAYMEWLQTVFPGKSPGELRLMGRDVRSSLREMVRGQEPGPFNVPKMEHPRAGGSGGFGNPPPGIGNVIDDSANPVPQPQPSAFGGGDTPPPPPDDVFRAAAEEGPAIRPPQSTARKIGDALLDIANVPREMMAMGELSATMRQGAVLGYSHPIAAVKAFSKTMRYSFREEKTAELIAQNKSRQVYHDMVENGKLFFSERGDDFTQGEELFVRGYFSKLIGKFPVLGWIRDSSERTFVNYLNTLRLDVADDVLRQWESPSLVEWVRGRPAAPITQQNKDELATFLNHATGRGDLPKFLGAGGNKFMNALFFAPRLTVSRGQLLVDLVNPKTSFRARKIIARDLTTFVGVGLGMMELLDNAPGVDVDYNPLSTNFGRVRAGKLTYDFLGGQQQLVRTAIQWARGKKAPAGGGEAYDKHRGEIVYEFLKSKLHPVTGLAADLAPLLKGETPTDFLGEPYSTDPQDIAGEAAQRLLPLFAQDVWEAFQEEGLTGAAKAAPAGFFGVGIVSYSTNDEKKQDTAREVKNVDFAALWPDEQRDISSLVREQRKTLPSDYEVKREALDDAEAQDIARLAAEAETIPAAPARGERGSPNRRYLPGLGFVNMGSGSAGGEDSDRDRRSDFLDRWYSTTREYDILRGQLYEETFGDREENLGGGSARQKRALRQYRDAAKQAESGNKIFDAKKWNRIIDNYMEEVWTPDQIEYVAASTNYQEIPESVLRLLGERARYRYELSQAARDPERVAQRVRTLPEEDE